jgi:hypothetical protein
MPTKKASPAQIAARKKFAEMARNGAFKKRKTNPRKKTVSQKISQLTHEGYPQKQAVAVALSEQRAGKVKRNPSMYAEKYKVDIAEWMREYKELEDINAHSENAVRLAELVGTKADQIAAKKILSNHLTLGYLSDIDYKNRQKIYSKLWPKAMKLFGMEIKKNPTRQRATGRSAVMANPRAKKLQKFYQVSIMEDGLHTKWMPIANFYTFSEAENYSHYLSKQHKNWSIRVHDKRAM